MTSRFSLVSGLEAPCGELVIVSIPLSAKCWDWTKSPIAPQAERSLASHNMRRERDKRANGQRSLCETARRGIGVRCVMC